MEAFAEGFLVAEVRSEIIGSFFAIQRERTFRAQENLNWLRDSGIGTGRTHDPCGNSLFSLSCTVSSQAPRGTYRAMMQAWEQLAIARGVRYLYAGSRLPGLSTSGYTPESYVARVQCGKAWDPILSKALATGFSLGRILPNYFDDPGSGDFGVEIYRKVKIQ